MALHATSRSKSAGGAKEDRSSLGQCGRFHDHNFNCGRPGNRSSREERRYDHDDEEREYKTRDHERAEAERKQRRRDHDWEEAERERRRRDHDWEESERKRRRRDLDREEMKMERRRRDHDWEEAERERRRRDHDWEEAERERRRRDLDREEMKRERRRRDREGKERESENDSERLKNKGNDKERDTNRMMEVEKKGNESEMNKDRGQRRKRTRWDEVGDNGGCSFGAMATHPTAPSTTITMQPELLEPGLLPTSSFAVGSSEKTSECLFLENVFDGSVRREDDFYLDVRDHIHRSCVRAGPVQHIYVDRKGFAYLRFYDETTAADAKKKLNGSEFNGSVITAKFMDAAKYRSRFPLK